MGFHDTNVFFSYAHEDDEYRIQLQEHLKLFERMGVISCWHDRGIIAGEEWEDSISSNLKAADIILALVSSAFLASEYCYGRELKRALSQHASGQSRLIPIIIRPVVWSDSALGKLQALPDNAKPVSTWSDRDAAWANVVRGIKRAVDTIKTQKQDFLRYIPSILQTYYVERHHLIETTDSPVKRNIEKLGAKHFDLSENINEYRTKLGAYGARLAEAIASLYESFLGLGKSNPAFGLLYSMQLQELHELAFNCATEELGIVQSLEENDLEPALFGFTDSTTAMSQTSEVMSSMSKTTSVLVEVLGTWSDAVKKVKEIGNQQSQEDDFEEV